MAFTNPGLQGLNLIRALQQQATQQQLAEAQRQQLEQQLAARKALADQFGPAFASPQDAATALLAEPRANLTEAQVQALQQQLQARQALADQFGPAFASPQDAATALLAGPRANLTEAQVQALQQQLQARRALADQLGPAFADPSAVAALQQAQAQNTFAQASASRALLQQEQERIARRLAAARNLVIGAKRIFNTAGPERAFEFIQRNAPLFGVTADELGQLNQALKDPQQANAVFDALLEALTTQDQEQASVTGQPIQVIDPETGEPALAQQFKDGRIRIIRDEQGNPIAPARFERGLAGEGEVILVDRQTGQLIGRQIPGTSAAARTQNVRIQTQERALDLRRQQVQAKARAEAANQRLKLLEDTIDKAISQTSGLSAGLLSGTRFIGGTPAADLSATLSTIQANIGFSELQRLRDESPTGGALGQVSNRENELLQSVFGSLSQSQSPSQLRENLRALKDQIKLSFNRVRQAFKETFGVEPVQGPNGIFDLRLPEGADAGAQQDVDIVIERDPQTGQLVIRQPNG